MKLTTATKDLRAALHRIGMTPGSRDIPGVTLRADEFGGLILTRTTRIAGMTVDAPATVHDEGRVTVAFEVLKNMVARLGAAEIELTSNDKKLRLKAGSATGELGFFDQELRELEPISSPPITVDSSDLKEFLRIADLAAWNEAGRDNFRGVCLRTMGGQYCIIGTDGRRIAAGLMGEAYEAIHEAMGYDGGVLLDKMVVAAIQELIGEEHCAARIKLNDRGGEVEVAGRKLRFAISTDCPPNVEKVLYDEGPDFKLTVNRLQLLSLVKRAAPLGYGDNRSIVLSYADDVLIVTADDRTNTFTDSIPATCTKEPIMLISNGDYMGDFLASAKADEVEINYHRAYHIVTIIEPDRRLLLVLIREQVIPHG